MKYTSIINIKFLKAFINMIEACHSPWCHPLDIVPGPLIKLKLKENKVFDHAK